jgi:soluble lytic murein transglycosylase-like protein
MQMPSIPNIKVSDILAQKISEIQGRVPVRMNGADVTQASFSSVLDDAMASLESAAPVIDPELLQPRETAKIPYIPSSTKTKYPLVSGSYESVYPRLSQTQIQELMPRIDKAIETYAEKFNLDPKLIRAVMKQESSFQPFALSTSGAMGLMQLMPGTAEGLGVDDPYNIEQNIRGGSQYLRYTLDAFDQNLDLALAAYNAGPNAVRKYGGIPPYEQTQVYVKKVKQYYQMYQELEGS